MIDNIIVPGPSLTKARTINSMYAKGYIEIVGNDDEVYRLHVDEILKMINKDWIVFRREKKRKFYHLTYQN